MMIGECPTKLTKEGLVIGWVEPTKVEEKVAKVEEKVEEIADETKTTKRTYNKRK